MILGYNWFMNNPRGWLMSEKMDGVRAYWDGHMLWTRGNKIINTPDWMLAKFPKGVGLDCELWHGRGNYRETMKIFQCKESLRPWETVKIGVFDAPKNDGEIEERINFLGGLRLPEPFFIVDYDVCRGMSHLKQAFESIFNANGEGLVLRKSGSEYLHERTTEFLKVKYPW